MAWLGIGALLNKANKAQIAKNCSEQFYTDATRPADLLLRLNIGRISPPTPGGGGAGPHSPAQGGHEAKEREAKALREIAIGTIAIMPNDTETSRGLLRQHESVCSEARVHIPYVIEATQEVARADPYERADITSNTYYDWLIDHVFLLVPAQDYVGQFLATFRDYQPRQKAPSFNMDEVLAKLKEAK